METDPDLWVRNRLESTLDIWRQRLLEGHNEGR